MVLRLPLLLLGPLLLAADRPTGPSATRVNLDGRASTLTAAAAELSRQANIPIDLDRANGSRSVQLQFTGLPFWDAVERLARAADHRLTVMSQGSRIALSREPYRARPTSVHGPFRFVARSVVGRTDFESGVTQHDVNLEMVWEPAFRAYYYELDTRSIKARDDAGRELSIVTNGSSRVPLGTETPELTLRLRGIPRSTGRIAGLEGSVKLLGTSQMLQFSFPLAEAMPTQKRAEVTAKLSSLRKNVRVWTAVVELEYPRDMPEFESFQSFLVDNDAWLLRSNGTKYPLKKFELGAERQGRFPIVYYIVENDKDGPVLSELNDWRMVIRVPGRIVEEVVPFRLVDVPLP